MTWDGRTGMILVRRPGATIPLDADPWPPGWDHIGEALTSVTAGLLTVDLVRLWTGGKPLLPFLLTALSAPTPPAPDWVAWQPDDGPVSLWPIRERVDVQTLADRGIVRCQWLVGDLRQVNIACPTA